MRRLLGGVQPESPTPSWPAGGDHVGLPRGDVGSDASFDTNMLIILAALLCALVCALGLNSVVRCALRRVALGTPDAGAASLPAKGLKKRALRRIPVAVYGRETGIPATDCPICLGDFADGEKVRVLPLCNHGFHVRCIDTWLASHSSCPTCRQSLLDRTAAAAAGDGAGGEWRSRANTFETLGGLLPTVD